MLLSAALLSLVSRNPNIEEEDYIEDEEQDVDLGYDEEFLHPLPEKNSMLDNLII